MWFCSCFFAISEQSIYPWDLLSCYFWLIRETMDFVYWLYNMLTCWAPILILTVFSLIFSLTCSLSLDILLVKMACHILLNTLVSPFEEAKEESCQVRINLWPKRSHILPAIIRHLHHHVEYPVPEYDLPWDKTWEFREDGNVVFLLMLLPAMK